MGQGEGIRNAQMAAPADFDQFGGDTRANEGFFFNYSGMYWTISAPKTATVGTEGSATVNWGPQFTSVFPAGAATTAQASTLNTSNLDTQWSGGYRLDLGYVEDHQGVEFTYWKVHGASQWLTPAGDVQVLFNDEVTGSAGLGHLTGFLGVDPVTLNTILGRVPVSFTQVTTNNWIKISGINLDYLYRTESTNFGGVWEWVIGAQYTETREQFLVEATGGFLDQTDITDLAYNRMVGAEIGLHWFLRSERWTWDIRSTFSPALNFQSVRQTGVVGSNLDGGQPRSSGPIAMPPTTFDNAIHPVEFAPIVDVRFGLKYNFTRNIAGMVEWDGMYIDNVARPSNMNNYSLNSDGTVMGLISSNNKQQLWLQGVTAGIEINR